MLEIEIDNTKIEVEEGVTILEAAKMLGIQIPNMCFGSNEFGNHPSCMLCVVKDAVSGKLIPACAHKVIDGMRVVTNDDDVFLARKDALELLLSNHVGDCEAPCKLSCPAQVDIPLMNRNIAKGDFYKALEVLTNNLALPLVMSYICEAPCENACRRKELDSSLSIRLLKKFVIERHSLEEFAELVKPEKIINQEVAIVGAGLAGISCAYYLMRFGYQVTVYEKSELLGGKLLTLLGNKLPNTILESELERLRSAGIKFISNTEIFDDEDFKSLYSSCTAVVLAVDQSSLGNFGTIYNGDGIKTNISNVFVCRNTINPERMAVRAVAGAKKTAEDINCLLNNLPLESNERMFNSKFSRLTESEKAMYLTECYSLERNSIKSELTAIKEEAVVLEAQDCMHCDCRKATSCKLRIYAHEYQADQKMYKLEQRAEIVKFSDHDYVVYEPEKCIRCGLCIEIAAKAKGENGLCFIGRGYQVAVMPPFRKSLNVSINQCAIDCVAACPTGALALKSL